MCSHTKGKHIYVDVNGYIYPCLPVMYDNIFGWSPPQISKDLTSKGINYMFLETSWFCKKCEINNYLEGTNAESK